MAFNQEWENVAVVGKGGSSTVYKALVKSAGKFVAVKQIEIDGLSKDQINGIKGEIETMKDLSHPNILCYLGTQQSPSRVFIFLEYADRGSLRQFYANRGPLSESQISYCLQGIVAGLNYLHENGIAHRDIKCANCLLGSEGVVKLADFGASKRFESDSIVSGLKGTPHWMAPEVIKGTQMTTGWMKADVWSLGCTVVEMFTAKVPYAEYENPMTAMYKIASGEIPSLKPSALQPLTASAEMVSFVHTCCAVEPATRPGADELLTHALLVREIESVGDLFADLALPVVLPDSAGVPNETEMKNEQPPILTQFEKESNKIARRSLDGESQPQAYIQAHGLTQRARSDSRSSVLSADDDETTIANAAETSYLEDDFCSYGFDEVSKSRSRGESLGFGGGIGIGMSQDAADDDAPTETEPTKEPRVLARLTPLSVPRATSTSRSSSRSRGQSRGGMMINTSATGISAVDLDESAGSNLDDVATPSVFRDNGRSASMQMHLAPRLDEQVGELTLSESAKHTTLSRKWSATAFPEKLLETMEQPATNDNKYHENSVDHSPIEEDIVPDETIFNETEDDVVAEIFEIPSSVSPAAEQQQGAKKTYTVPVVPSFEDASEVYKSMLLKYSPRASQDTSSAAQKEVSENVATELTPPSSKATNDEEIQESASAQETAMEEITAVAGDVTDSTESTEMLVSPVLEAPPAVRVQATTGTTKSGGKVSSPTIRSGKLTSQSSSASQSPSHGSSSRKEKSSATAIAASPSARKKPTPQLGALPLPILHQETDGAPMPISQNNLHGVELNEVQIGKRTQQRSKPKPIDLGPLDADRTRPVDPLRKQPAPVQLRTVVPAPDHNPIKARAEDSSRPYAPLSGEKLRLHSFADPNKKPLSQLGRDGAPGSSAEALERIVNQSGAAAVRKGAAQELREVRTHRAKGSLSHHVIKSTTTKRPRNQMSPRRAHAHAQQVHPNNQLGSAPGQDRVTANMGLGGGASLMSNGGVRSQSAGVTTGYTTGRKDAQKLPPVLRGMNRNAIGSSSGSIDPIEEGRIVRGVLSGQSPLRLEGPTSRYIQSAPAVSRSVNLPPINGSSSQANRPGHRHGASVDGSTALSIEDSSEDGAYLTSQTPNPKSKQPRLHNFGRPAHPSGVSAVLQQSFANVMKNYADDEQQVESSVQDS